MAERAVTGAIVLLNKLIPILAEEISLLGELRFQVEDIKVELDAMKSFLRDADKKKQSNRVIKNWLDQVRDVAYDVEDLLDEFFYRFNGQPRQRFKRLIRSAIQLPKDVFIRHKIASRLHQIKARVESISVRRERYPQDLIEEATSSGDSSRAWQRRAQISLSVEDDQIVGMKEKVELLVGVLVDREPQRRVISVTGMGGLGKTTLVTKAYQSHVVKNHFNCSACVSLSQTPKISELLRSLIIQLFLSREEMVPTNIGMIEDGALIQMAKNYLQSKRYLVILDDVWTVNDWIDLREAFPDSRRGSRIMLTTRDVEVASALGDGSWTYPLEPLNGEEALVLFYKKAFGKELCPPSLHPLAQIFVEKCEGLPLAIVAIAGLLAMKDKTLLAWENVYKSLKWQLSNNDMLKSIKSILFLSFNDLPYYLKDCFLYSSIFPEDHLIHRKQLIRLWMAQGFLEEIENMEVEDVAEDYLMQLIHRNMIQLVETNKFGRVKTCRIHDLMRELALSKSKEEKFSMVYTGQEGANPGDKIRHLSICGSGESFQLDNSMPQLRSFLIFDENVPSSASLHKFISGFKLVRVLDLQGAAIECVPSGLTDLFNLRYLNLANTCVRELPSSIGRLKNLKILDIRNTEMKRLPKGLLKLQKLRHLLLTCKHASWSERFNYFSSIKVPNGVSCLKELRTLFDIEANEEIIKQVGHLSHLRRFGICKLRAVDGEEMCNSIRKMEHLRNLSVTSIDEHEFLQLETLSSPPPNLQKLGLYGHLEKVPHWFSSVINLTCLWLSFSGLREDPLSSLHALPNLVFLSLSKAYDGQQLTFCSRGFPKLKTLTLITLAQLGHVKIEKGAMPCIHRINISRCSQLKMVPEGIEYLTGLQHLYLLEMPKELIDLLQGYGGTDYKKVKHIPDIKHGFQREGDWIVDQLS